MCGIVGIVNGKKNRFANGRLCSYLRDAIVANSLRGFDSTGIVQATKDKKHLVFTNKAAVDGVRFIANPDNHFFLRDADDTAFTFVHNRAATRGVIKEENAHPFQHTNDNDEWLIGCHNGTLSGWSARDHEVDSDWALAQIAEDGIDAFEKFDGAFTFVWYGDREGTDVLNIARNSQRPMFVAYIKGEDRMLFASEYLMMVWLAERNGLSLDEEIIDLEPGYLYQFSTDNPREFKKTHLPTYKVKPKHVALFEALEGIFRTVREEPTPTPKKVTKPATTTNVVELHPTKKQSRVQKKKEKKATGTYVTAEEFRIGEASKVNGEEVSIYLEEYVAKDNEAWGVCEVGKDTYAVVIRSVDRATYDTWRIAESVSAKVVGGFAHDNKGSRELALIASRNVKVDEGSELSSAIGSSIKRFTESRNDTGSIH
jgi:glucosamine 6-phosphate synthetase-like amidotransferase/phosphosugar isomerase protein